MRSIHFSRFLFFLIPGLFFMCLAACQKTENLDNQGQENSKSILKNIIDEGEMLLYHEKEEEHYNLYFETQKITLPVEGVSSFTEYPEKWEAICTFKDGSQIKIPFQGESLDFIVKDLTLNPSGFNPLAARVEVHLPSKGRVKVEVHGKSSEDRRINHLFQAYQARQHIPILGLYQDYENKVDLVFTNKEGKERGRTTVKIQTKPLPSDFFPTLHLIHADKEKMEPGVNLVSYPGQSEIDTSCPYMVDENGEIRWILLFKESTDLKDFGASIGLHRLSNGNFISGDTHQNRLLEIDVLGNKVNEWKLGNLGYSYHHEVAEAKNGNFLITVTKNDARLTNGKPRVNDHIIELDPQSGRLVREWDLAQMLDSSRYFQPDGTTPEGFSQTPNNWAHNNAITELGTNLLATLRYQGIVSFSPGGQVQWIISPHKGWSHNFKGRLLKPVDKSGQLITDPTVINGEAAHPDFDWAWGVHTPVALPDGDILVFDNGYNRHFIDNALTEETNYSRIVRYKIDEAKNTVQQVWAYGQNRGRETFGQALSGVQYLNETEHVLFCPGMGTITQNGYGGHVIEVDPETDKVVFELQITSPTYTAFHRVTRMPMYPPNL